MTSVPNRKRRLLVSCQVFQREIRDCLSRIDCPVEVSFLPFGIHGESAEVARVAIQQAVDAADPSIHECVLVGYGLCNYGVRGLVARNMPLVIPRVHDCIGLLLGDRERYQGFCQNQTGTYFQTSGWVDAADVVPLASLDSGGFRAGAVNDLSLLIERYGEDNGRYLNSVLNGQRYRQHMYITSGVSEEDALIDRTRQRARQAGCSLQVERGTMRLLEALLAGPWDDDEFLRVPAGMQVDLAYDGRLLCWKEPMS